MKIYKPCPVCGTEFVTRYARQICCSMGCARSKDAKVHGPRNWGGGVYRHGSGYLKELAKENPAADKYGYVMQHRLVMEQVLGRHLLPHERVHHKNGVRDDNRPENLELWDVNNGKKDPPGQRLIDKVRHMLSRLSPADRDLVLQEFQA